MYHFDLLRPRSDFSPQCPGALRVARVIVEAELDERGFGLRSCGPVRTARVVPDHVHGGVSIEGGKGATSKLRKCSFGSAGTQAL